MQLSKRLLTVAGMVTSARCLADVGTDHGYIPIYLVEEGIVSSAIAMDINKGPLQRASENIERHGLSGRIGTRLSDGLKALAPGEADCVVIAGMGGGLVKKILTEGREALESVRELILQPQSELEEVRRFLWEQGYVTEAEEMVLEDGKYYPMMRLRPPYAAGETEGGPGRDGKTKRRDLAGNCEEAKSREAAVNCEEAESREAAADCGKTKRRDLAGNCGMPERFVFKYGPLLLRQRHPCLLSFLQWEQGIYENVLLGLEGKSGEGITRRRKEIEDELHCIEKAKECFR